MKIIAYKQKYIAPSTNDIPEYSKYFEEEYSIIPNIGDCIADGKGKIVVVSSRTIFPDKVHVYFEF